jgi:hypothetical protein
VSRDNAQFASVGGDKQVGSLGGPRRAGICLLAGARPLPCRCGSGASGSAVTTAASLNPSPSPARPARPPPLSPPPGQVFLWDVSTGKVIRKFRGHDAAINAVRRWVSPEGRRATDRGEWGGVFWSKARPPRASFRQTCGRPQPPRRPSHCAPRRRPLPQVTHAAGDEVLVTGGYDQCVRVWDCKSRSTEPIQTMRAFKVPAGGWGVGWGGGA